MRITIHGSYGTGNRGDNVILLQLLRFLDRETPGAYITVLCRSVERVNVFLESEFAGSSLSITPVNASFRKSFFRVLAACVACDLFILGGGGLLWGRAPGNLAYWLQRPQIAQFARRHVAFYVPGIYNVSGTSALRLLRKVARRADFLSTRDNEGLDQLILAGLEESDIILGADPAFLLQTPKRRRIEALRDALGLGGRRLVGLSARDWRGRFSAGLFAKFVHSVLEDDRATLLFFAMKTGGRLGEIDSDDLSVATDLLRTLDRDMAKRMLIIGDNYSIEETIALMGACEYVIGMRLHALIFASIAGTPFAGVSYDEKVTSYMHMLGRERFLMQMSDVADPQLLESVANSLRDERSSSPEGAPVDSIVISAGQLSVRAQVMHRKLAERLKEWFPPKRRSPATGGRRQ